MPLFRRHIFSQPSVRGAKLRVTNSDWNRRLGTIVPVISLRITTVNQNTGNDVDDMTQRFKPIKLTFFAMENTKLYSAPSNGLGYYQNCRHWNYREKHSQFW